MYVIDRVQLFFYFITFFFNFCGRCNSNKTWAKFELRWTDNFKNLIHESARFKTPSDIFLSALLRSDTSENAIKAI